MREEDLDLLITQDDPGEDDLEEDTFHDVPVENTSQPFIAKRRHDQRIPVKDSS